jgi:hypothetical protein
MKMALGLLFCFLAATSGAAEEDVTDAKAETGTAATTSTTSSTASAPESKPVTEEISEVQQQAPDAAPESERLKNRSVGAALGRFRPSEEISADNAVPFPVDI